MSAKDLRSKFTGSKARPGRLVTLDIGDEKVELELRAPGMAAKGAIARLAGAAEGVEPDLELLTVHFIVRCAYAPGTNDKVFSPDDVPLLVALGPALDPLTEAALQLFQGDPSLGNG